MTYQDDERELEHAVSNLEVRELLRKKDAENERLRAENVLLRGAIDTILTAAKAARELLDNEQIPRDGTC